MSKKSASPKHTWSEVAKTCVNEDVQDRDVAFVFTANNRNRRLSVRQIVEHELAKKDTAAEFTKFLKSGEGETEIAKLCKTSKSIKSAILEDSNPDKAFEQKIEEYLMSERGLQFLSQVIPKTQGAFWNHLALTGVQPPGMNLPSAPSKNSTGPRNGKREIVTVDSDPDDVIDEDFSGSPGKKTKVEGETTAGDSMYDKLVNMPSPSTLERTTQIQLERYVFECVQRDETLTKELRKLGYEPTTAAEQLQFFLFCLDWHGSRARSAEAQPYIKYYAREWILAHQELIHAVPTGISSISNHNFGTNSTKRFNAFKRQYQAAFNAATKIHKERAQSKEKAQS